jgi:hypothetical protein
MINVWPTFLECVFNYIQVNGMKVNDLNHFNSPLTVFTKK